MGKFFTVEVNPTITASKQHAAAFAAGDVLFDWTSFQIPKGSARLLSTIATVRGTNASTLGDLNDPVDTATATGSSTTGWFRNIIGYQFFDASAQGMGSSDDLVYMNTIQSPGNGGVGNLVLTGEPESGDNVGYDTIYVAGISQGALDFSTTDKGSNDDPDADLIFQPGDVIHTGTDDALGTIQSIAAFGSSKQDITLTSGFDVDVADNEELYNLNPIKLIFSFEK